MKAPWDGPLSRSGYNGVDFREHRGAFVGQGASPEYAEALVHRANAFDTLVIASGAALSALEATWEAIMSNRHPDLEQINDAMKATRAALASAKGEG